MVNMLESDQARGYRTARQTEWFAVVRENVGCLDCGRHTVELQVRGSDERWEVVSSTGCNEERLEFDSANEAASHLRETAGSLQEREDTEDADVDADRIIDIARYIELAWGGMRSF